MNDESKPNLTPEDEQRLLEALSSNLKFNDEPKPFEVTPELQAAIDSAVLAVRNRTYAGRNAHLGKMIKCQVCGLRHRQFERKCAQVFTNRVDHDNYELLKENESGELVPDYRTAAKEGERPTIKQIVGAAAFNKKRFHPHYSKKKLLFIQRTREVYDQLKSFINLLGTPAATRSKLETARIIASRQLREERRLRTRATNRQRDKARRINRGMGARA